MATNDPTNVLLLDTALAKATDHWQNVFTVVRLEAILQALAGEKRYITPATLSPTNVAATIRTVYLQHSGYPAGTTPHVDLATFTAKYESDIAHIVEPSFDLEDGNGGQREDQQEWARAAQSLSTDAAVRTLAVLDRAQSDPALASLGMTVLLESRLALFPEQEKINQWMKALGPYCLDYQLVPTDVVFLLNMANTDRHLGFQSETAQTAFAAIEKAAGNRLILPNSLGKAVGLLADSGNLADLMAYKDLRAGIALTTGADWFDSDFNARELWEHLRVPEGAPKEFANALRKAQPALQRLVHLAYERFPTILLDDRTLASGLHDQRVIAPEAIEPVSAGVRERVLSDRLVKLTEPKSGEMPLEAYENYLVSLLGRSLEEQPGRIAGRDSDRGAPDMTLEEFRQRIARADRTLRSEDTDPGMFQYEGPHRMQVRDLLRLAIDAGPAADPIVSAIARQVHLETVSINAPLDDVALDRLAPRLFVEYAANIHSNGPINDSLLLPYLQGVTQFRELLESAADFRTAEGGVLFADRPQFSASAMIMRGLRTGSATPPNALGVHAAMMYARLGSDGEFLYEAGPIERETAAMDAGREITSDDLAEILNDDSGSRRLRSSERDVIATTFPAWTRLSGVGRSTPAESFLTTV